VLTDVRELVSERGEIEKQKEEGEEEGEQGKRGREGTGRRKKKKKKTATNKKALFLPVPDGA
jgi:hypothetical protein